MSTLYKIVGKNIGKDVSVTITDSLGNSFNAAQIGILTHFEVTADDTLDETQSIVNDGQSFYESLPHGIKIVLKFVRHSAALEKMYNQRRAAARAGNMVSYGISYSVKNRDGSVDSNMVSNGKPHNWVLGQYAPGATGVQQSVEFMFSAMDDTGARAS